MSVAAAGAVEREVFPARAIIILILAGVVALAGFGLLATYAPELRGRSDGGAHALSSSAVGYRGAQIMLKALGIETQVARTRPNVSGLRRSGLVLTPGPTASSEDLDHYPLARRTLIVLPKWRAVPDPKRPGFVLKTGLLGGGEPARRLLAGFGPGTTVTVEPGLQRRTLQASGEGGTFAQGSVLPLGRLDGLQTIGGPGWRPVLADSHGDMVLAQSVQRPGVFVLADPDLLNNQGLGDIDTARAGMAVLQMIAGDDGLIFDVTLNGFGQGRSLARLMLSPPWLAATLCVVAAVVLTGWQALARFAAPLAEGRAIALGAAALVDNSAGLVRMGRREAALAPDYARTTFGLV
ncbi:MAG TPA: hypothetical protein VJS38_03765, partial [Phenylobacterium sp.]|uniref:hypothetical protein n=1 Tax=Phenylobacterium sp. TaxID=1871053 RepID=UPI002B46CA85